MTLHPSIHGPLLVTVGLSIAPVTAGAQPVAAIPITVERVHLAEPGRPGSPQEVVIVVRNVGAATIEAWGVSGEVRYSNGETRFVGVGADSYETTSLPESLRPSAGNSKRLPPGGRATIVTTMQTPLPMVTALGASGVPTYAVFEDDTAVGDERLIEHLFKRRQMN